jgi:hypothetical protein
MTLVKWHALVLTLFIATLGGLVWAALPSSEPASHASGSNPASGEAQVDEAFAAGGDEVWLWFADSDGDGFGDPGHSEIAATQLPGYVRNSLDRDDTNPMIGLAEPESHAGRDSVGVREADERS